MTRSLNNPYNKTIEEISWSGLITEQEEGQLMEYTSIYNQEDA